MVMPERKISNSLNHSIAVRRVISENFQVHTVLVYLVHRWIKHNTKFQGLDTKHMVGIGF